MIVVWKLYRHYSAENVFRIDIIFIQKISRSRNRERTHANIEDLLKLFESEKKDNRDTDTRQLY